MFHDSQGIQQQGWLIQVTEENAIKPSKHGKSASGPMGKNRSSKHRSTCQNCGTEFNGRPKAANRFCQNSCQHEFSVNRWIECSKCLAKMGIGSKIAGRLLGISGSTVTRGWQNQGIVSVRPKSGSIVRDGRSISTKIKDQKISLWREYERAWMRQMREEERSFPDWSIYWINDAQNRKAAEKYNSAEAIYERSCYREILQHRMLTIYPNWSVLWSRSRMAMSPSRKAIDNLRTRLKEVTKKAINGKSSNRSSLIGCSPIQIKKHIESGFKRGMDWDNYGTIWHIDHIMPCASFDHSDPAQARQCWHLTNLRPLRAKDNLAKRDNITDPQLSLLLCASYH